MEQAEMAILAIYVVINVFAFLAFLMDKTKSKLGWWRKSEALLLILALFGAIGATLGMWICHHKVSKLKFKLVYVFLVLHIVVIALFLTGTWKLPSF